jgi:hypothetical protein
LGVGRQIATTFSHQAVEGVGANTSGPPYS